MQQKTLVLCVTGASGAIYAKSFLDIAVNLGLTLDCIFSENGKRVFQYELGLPYRVVKDYYSEKGFRFHEPDNLFSPLASGSILSKFAGVVVLPCSIGTLGAVANGVVNNLIHRVCDVALKERVPLVMAVREMPLNQTHLENMLKLQQMGASAFVISPGFYNRPKSIEEIAAFTVGKILDLLRVEHSIYRRWGGT